MNPETVKFAQMRFLGRNAPKLVTFRDDGRLNLEVMLEKAKCAAAAPQITNQVAQRFAQELLTPEALVDLVSQLRNEGYTPEEAKPLYALIDPNFITESSLGRINLRKFQPSAFASGEADFPSLDKVEYHQFPFGTDKVRTRTYQERFAHVAEFREGVASVTKVDDDFIPRLWALNPKLEPAYFIHYDGTPLSKNRFLHAARFSEGFAPVARLLPYKDEPHLCEQWFHVNRSGERAYEGSYYFVGNFSEGLAMVQERTENTQERAYHIDTNGKPAYVKRFLYVDEFCNGLAVAHEGEPMNKVAYHIHPDGTPAYESRFRAVGFFEGELATAHTEEGLFYIDRTGTLLGPVVE